MSAFMIEIAQGCVKTWKKSTKSITIAELRSLMQESPQSFKGDVGGVDFRLEVGGAVLQGLCAIPGVLSVRLVPPLPEVPA